jgi:hypothetical protein
MMFRRAIQCFIVAIACAGSVGAQVVIEPEVVTDSIDIFADAGEESAKSASLARFLSLVAPGLGHYYLDMRQSASRYFAAEALAIAGFFFSNHYSRRLFQDSREWAYRYAGIQQGADEEIYWKLVGEYMDSERGSIDRQSGYNQVQRHFRAFDDIYWRDEQQWSWLDEESRNAYNDMRIQATHFKTVSSMFIAGMVLNRAIAFVNVRRATRHKGITGSVRLSAHPHMSLSARRVGVTLDGLF